MVTIDRAVRIKRLIDRLVLLLTHGLSDPVQVQKFDDTREELNSLIDEEIVPYDIG